MRLGTVSVNAVAFAGGAAAMAKDSILERDDLLSIELDELLTVTEDREEERGIAERSGGTKEIGDVDVGDIDVTGAFVNTSIDERDDERDKLA